MIQFVSKERYINSIANGEKAFLIYVDNDSTVWLQADMEIGGNSEQYRVELMDFELNPQEGILLTTVECRGFYCGGIRFIEYEKNAESTYTFALANFLNLQGNAKYLLCEDTDLSPISKAKTDQYYYIYVL